MNFEEINYIKDWKYVYAKSYADTFPHYYTTRGRVCDDYKFDKFLRFIREYGKVKTFYQKQYVYLEIDGYEYWEMGRPIPAVQVINMAQINDGFAYRYPNPSSEDAAALKKKLQEREEYLKQLILKPEKTEQDNRQIKFLLNSERRIHGGGKNIIDHVNVPIRYE